MRHIYFTWLMINYINTIKKNEQNVIPLSIIWVSSSAYELIRFLLIHDNRATFQMHSLYHPIIVKKNISVANVKNWDRTFCLSDDKVNLKSSLDYRMWLQALQLIHFKISIVRLLLFNNMLSKIYKWLFCEFRNFDLDIR